MTRVQAQEIAQQLEELIFVTVNKIEGLRRENSIAGMREALVAAFPTKGKK